MILKYKFLTLLVLINFSCLNQEIDSKTTIPVIKHEKLIVYGDEVLEATLNNIQVDGSKLKGDLEFLNKRKNKVYFHLKDFVFKCGTNSGIIPNRISSEKEMIKEVPNLENMRPEEQRIAIMKNFREHYIQKTNHLSLWNMIVSLKPNEKLKKEISIEFQSEIEIEKLKFYFNGEYKSLLSF